MRPERWLLREISLPLKAPFHAAWGSERTRRLIIVEAHGDGAIGYGEVSALSAPFYTEETIDTAWYVLETFLIPLAVERPWQTPRQLADVLRPVRRHFMAKAGLEGAVWDLLGRCTGLPLAALLASDHTAKPTPEHVGLPTTGEPVWRVPAGAVLGLNDDVGELVADALRVRDEGYRRLKVKIAPGWDYEPLRHLREAVGEFPLSADANGSYTREDLPALQRLDDLNLTMIEQPLASDDIIDHVHVQRALRTPICLDESITSAEDARKAIDLGSCRIICIKPGRVGGLSEAKKLHDLCLKRGVPVWCGGMLESGIGKAHSLALATLPGFTLPGDFAASDRYWEEDVVEPPITVDADGCVSLPQGPGIGWHVRRDLLKALTVREREFKA